MDKLEMAKALFRSNATPNGSQTTTAYGIAMGDSSAGTVMVDLGGDTVSTDDDQTVEVETTFAVKEGDQVIVSLVGADGTGKSPTVIGVVGRGDETQAEITAITNYFWTDAYGAHVSTEAGSVNGANVLLDSDSLDIRKGNSNSEADQTVYASFGREVTVGRRGTGSVGNYSQVYGFGCVASGQYSSALGYQNTVSGYYSHAEGYGNTVSGMYCHAEGNGNSVSNMYSHAEGNANNVSGSYSHSEGYSNTVSGEYSHAEGYTNQVLSADSHAEGSNNVINEIPLGGGLYESSVSHAEGTSNAITGTNCHVEGMHNEITADLAHAEGFNNRVASKNQHVQGKFNVSDGNDTYADIIGNGNAGTRSNAYNLDWDGNAEFQGEVYVGGCTPNGETPYPVVRYNTGSSQMEYYDSGTSTWIAISGGSSPTFGRSTVNCAFSNVTAGSSAGGNLKNVIDADMPSGATFFAISGFYSPYGDMVPIRLMYADQTYSYYFKNVGSVTRTGNFQVEYLYTT